MLFLKTKQKWGNSGSHIWIDANSSIRQMIKAYPQNAGNGTLTEKAKALLSKEFIQYIYSNSYSEYAATNCTDLEAEILSGLPTNITEATK